MAALQFTAHDGAASFLAVADTFPCAAEVENSIGNPTSDGVYRKMGYRPVAYHFHFDLVPAPA